MIALSARRLEEAAELGRGLISELTDAGLLVVDSETRILMADGDAYEAVDRNGLLGRRVQDVIPAAAWHVLRPHYAAALAGRAQSFVYEAVSEPTIHQIRMSPIRDDGAVIGLMVIAENVSQEVRAGRRLAGSERLQRSVLEVLDEGILVIAPDRTLLQANPAALAMLQLDLEDARANPDWWKSYEWRESADGHLMDIDATVLSMGQGIRDVDIEAVLPDGGHIRVSANLCPLRDDEGEVSGLVVSVRDVTEQMTAHEKLVASQERLRAAYAVARLSSWEWDPETDMVMVFQALTAHRELTGTEVALDVLLEGMSPAGREGAREDYAALVAGERCESVRRASFDHSDGTQWLETRMRPVHDKQGKLLRIRGTSQDVTEQELAKQQTAAARDFFQTTLDSLSAHIAVLDDEGRIIMTNRAWVAFAEAAGSEPADLGENYLTACDAAGDEPDAGRAAAGLRAIISGQETEFLDEYACHGPGGEAWYVLRAARFEGPGDACVVVSHENVTERHQAEDEAATQAALLDEVDVAVVATDNDGLVTQWNRGAEELYGWTADEMRGRNVEQVLSPPGVGVGAGEDYITQLQRTGQRTSQFELRRSDGSTFPASVHGRVMTDAHGRPTGRVHVSVDMSERVAAERAQLAARDYMRAVADSMGEGMFTLDVEGRLTYMNAAAERLLGWPREEIEGQVMHHIVHFRRADGSDLPIEECPILQARERGQTVRVEDDLFIRRDGRELPVAYTSSPFETEEGVEGCVVIFDDISERKASEARLQREADKLAWIGRIQEALAEDRFVLYAQPIVDLGTDAVVQSELLLRLRGEDGQIIAPGEYLGVAEQYGLIGEIDRWVIERGIEIAATGRPIEINVSAQSVGDQGILRHIEDCLQASGADPGLIVFEITETAIVEDEGTALAFTERLHALGCKLALDDFGTGYGGFTYLKQLPVDFLKIDIEFVRDLVTNPGSRHVVEAVVGLAQGFGLQTVAEGVEDAEAYALLRELGVDFAQGYFIARPGPLNPEPTGGSHDR